MRYFVYILGFALTLLAIGTRTLNPEKNGIRKLTPAGYLAALLALAVLLISIAGTCSDQRRIQSLTAAGESKIFTSYSR